MTPFPVPLFVAEEYAVFYNVVKLAFSQRRKMIRNTLKSLISENELRSLAISPLNRAENLALSDYVKIANFCVHVKIKGTGVNSVIGMRGALPSPSCPVRLHPVA
jgi:16S rRNA A1518/A1519 N6-dimethyltransferase RsmA/KsgA/DIM1 with predicted DNA glycosylase/AP lyase activity